MELYIYGWLTIDFYDSTDERKIHFPPKISSLPAVSIIRTMMGKQTKRTTRRRIFDTEEREREGFRALAWSGTSHFRELWKMAGDFRVPRLSQRVCKKAQGCKKQGRAINAMETKRFSPLCRAFERITPPYISSTNFPSMQRFQELYFERRFSRQI